MKKSRAKKILKWLGGLLLVLLMTTFTLLQWPQLWLTSETLDWVNKEYNSRSDDFTLSWDRSRVETDSLGLFKNRILLELEDVCLRGQDLQRVCFEKFDAGFAYSLIPLRLHEIGPIRGINGQVLFRAPHKDASPDPRKENKFELPAFLAHAEIKPAFVEIKNYRVHLGDFSLEGNSLLTSESSSSANGEVLALTLALKEKKYGNLNVVATTRSSEVRGPWSLYTRAESELPNKLRLDLQAWVNPTEEQHQYSFKTTAKIQSQKLRGNLNSKGHYLLGTLTGNLHANAKLHGKKFQIVNCHYKANLTKNERLKISTRCPTYFLIGESTVSTMKKAFKSLGIAKLGGSIVSQFETSFPPSPDQSVEGSLLFIPVSNLSRTLLTDGQIQVEFKVVPNQWPRFQHLYIKTDLAVHVRDFQELVATLDQSAYAIPAPLRALQGRLDLKTDGLLDQKGGHIDLMAESKLKSANQNLDVQIKSQTQLSLEKLMPSKINNITDVILKNVRLALPPIKGTPAGRYIADSRIHATPFDSRKKLKPNQSQSQIPLHYRINISTPPRHPMELTSDITEDHLSIALSLNIEKSQPTYGKIIVSPVQFEIGGVEGNLGTTELNFRNTRYQMLAVGHVSAPRSNSLIEIVYSTLPAEPLLRPQPKLPIPLVELASALKLKVPLSIAVTDDRRMNPPQNQTAHNPVFFQIRRRY